MKRHRFLNFYIDSTKSLFSDITSTPLMEKYKEEEKDFFIQKYGTINFEEKFERWLSVPTPNLSIVDEHTHLLRDIEDAYISNSLYAALTGACCLGERIFNQIIIRVKESYRSTPEYKAIYNKDSVNDWILAINTLYNWGIIKSETKNRYQRLAKLRTESVHFQDKKQDLISMAKDAIRLINEIVSDLFQLNKEKDFLIWFEVPGELYLKKAAESVPFIQAFYIPCAPLVGYKHDLETIKDFKVKIVDPTAYPNEDVSDKEFVRLRNEYNNKKH